MRNFSQKKMTSQSGMTIVGLIFVLAIVGIVLVIAAQVVPTVIEYRTISNAIKTARASGNSVQEIRASFDKQADVGYVTSIKGTDLVIEKDGADFDVSFAYAKKIPLVGPASLILEYEGTTSKKVTKTKKIAE